METETGGIPWERRRRVAEWWTRGPGRQMSWVTVGVIALLAIAIGEWRAQDTEGWGDSFLALEGVRGNDGELYRALVLKRLDGKEEDKVGYLHLEGEVWYVVGEGPSRWLEPGYRQEELPKEGWPLRLDTDRSEVRKIIQRRQWLRRLLLGAGSGMGALVLFLVVGGWMDDLRWAAKERQEKWRAS